MQKPMLESKSIRKSEIGSCKSQLPVKKARPKLTWPALLENSTRVLMLCALMSLMPLTPTYAQGSDTQRRAAIANAMEQAGGYGKVLSVKPRTTKDGKPGFRIRILTDGRVKTFDVAAKAE